MSVATDFAPSVPIPPRARAVRHLQAVEQHAVEQAARDVVPPSRLRVTSGAMAGAAELATVAVLRPPRTGDAVGPVRLTRRGVAALALFVAALGAALVWAAALSSSTPAPSTTAGPAAVTVRAGDTLWSIAGRVAPQRDSRAEVAVLQRLNGLRGAYLVPGQQLRVR